MVGSHVDVIGKKFVRHVVAIGYNALQKLDEIGSQLALFQLRRSSSWRPFLHVFVLVPVSEQVL